MPEVITAVLAHTWRETAARTIAVVDNIEGTRNESIGASGTYYRQALVKSSADGSERNPYGYLAHVGAQLGAAWELGAVASGSGFFYIKYLGTGTGTITWDGTGGTSAVPRNLLGFTTNVSLATNATLVATYHPAAVMFTIGRRNCKGYELAEPMAAYDETEAGYVYGWSSGVERATLGWEAIGHPSDWTTRTSLGAAGTPIYPSVNARILAPGSTPLGAAGPFSVTDFRRWCRGMDIAYVNNYPGLLAGTVTTFDRLQLSAASIMAREFAEPMQANWSARYNLKRLVFNVIEIGAS